jgi:hypothetical protein
MTQTQRIIARINAIEEVATAEGRDLTESEAAETDLLTDDLYRIDAAHDRKAIRQEAVEA